MSWIDGVWWIIGGACVLTGLVQMVVVLRGPAEARGRVVVGVVLIVLGGFCLIVPSFGEGVAPPNEETEAGPAARIDAVPLDELLRSAAAEPGASAPAHLELIARAGTLDAQEAARVIAWSFEGDATAAPPSLEWQHRYGSILEALYAVRSDTAKLISPADLTLPPTYELAHRNHWPHDARPSITVHTRHWWPPEYGLFAEVLDRAGTDLRRTGARTWALAVQPDDAGRYRVPVTIRLSRIRLAAPQDRELVLEDSVTLDGTIGGEVRDVLPPVSSPAMDRLLSERVRIDLVDLGGGPALRIDPGATLTPLFDDVAIGVQLELFMQDQPVCTLPACWPAGTDGAVRPLWLRLPVDIAELCMTTDHMLTARLRPDPALALQCPSATRHWQGDATLPVHRAIDGPNDSALSS